MSSLKCIIIIYDAPTVVGSAQRQLPCPLDVRFGDTFVVGNTFSDKLDTWHGVVSRVDLGLRSFAVCPSQCETAIANIGQLSIGPFGDNPEMQTLQNKCSEWMGLSGPNVQLVISTTSATDEVASTRNISDLAYVRGYNTPVTPEARCNCGACTALTAVAPPLLPWLRSGSVIDRRSTADNCQNRGPSIPVTPEARCHCRVFTA